jgi:hypothetical protein
VSPSTILPRFIVDSFAVVQPIAGMGPDELAATSRPGRSGAGPRVVRRAAAGDRATGSESCVDGNAVRTWECRVARTAISSVCPGPPTR